MFPTEVDIIDIDNTSQATALRSMLEFWQIKVNLYRIGKIADLEALFQGYNLKAPTQIWMCDGDNEGVLLPRIGPSTVTAESNQRISSKQMAQFLDLDAQLVLNTGSRTGAKNFGKVFLDSGAKAYIAPDNYPEYNLSLYFLVNFCFEYLVLGHELKESYLKVLEFQDMASMYRLYIKQVKYI